MKNAKVTNKKGKRAFFLLSSFFLFSLLSFLSCEQPFKAGLGPVVDVRPPTVRLEAPGAGEYIWGSNRSFNGEAEDDYILRKVELVVTNHPEIDYLREFTEVSLNKSSQNKGKWELNIDTTKFPDGDLKVQIRAEDSVSKEAVTDEIVFLVKNEPPAINMTSPYIARGDKDGEVSGPHLNYGTVNVLPGLVNFPRQMDKGSFLSGNISDQDDIYMGSDDGTRYPPQIRIWRVNEMGDPNDLEGYLPGVLPSPAEAPWQTFRLNENLFMLGLGNYQFTWELPETAGRFYGFEVRAQSKDGRTEFHYPRDFYPNVNPDSWEDLTEAGEYKQENRYVLIYVRSPREYPVVEIYGLEDILGPDGWDGAYKTIEGVDDNMSHPYVNKVTVNKNGPFTLRIKASHSDGIGSAEVYWETEDKTSRGRFIWDPADTPPINNPALAPHFNVGTDRPYSEWGFRDPHSYSNGYYNIRNFIFTYKHAEDKHAEDVIPDTEQYHPQIQGRSRIQKFKSNNNDAWQEGKRSGMWPIAGKYDENRDPWEDVTTLEEGVYNIEVYARSTYGTAIATPFYCDIRLDWEAPEAEVLTIDGAYSEDLINGNAVVNGVIRPRLRFADSRPQDAGLRAANDAYYKRPGMEIYGYEQRYILVRDGDNNQFDRLIASNNSREYWPPVPDSAEDDLVINGIRALKHGPIFDSSCIFKTSKIYDAATEETDALAAGAYWLYVFVRDNAFNVGNITPLRIQVDPETDRPVLDFQGSVTTGVKDPDSSHDGQSDGFQYGPDLRNKFGPNSAVRLRLRDDDSLALGFANGAASKLKVGFVGSFIDTDRRVKAHTDEKYIMELSDAQIKALFIPLPGAGEDPEDGEIDFRPVRDRSGEITQTVLLNLLRSNENYNYLFTGNKNTYTTLPDGLYRISVSIEDYPPAKLVVKEGDDPAIPAERSEWFWIAVDTANPVIDSPEEYPNGYIPVSGVRFTGTVSDRNGPVTLVAQDGFTIIATDSQGQPIRGSSARPGNVTITQQAADADGLWKGAFTAPVTLGSYSGNYTFTLRFQDRFGNISSITKAYKLDANDPEVAMRTEVKTFDRSDAINFPGVGGTPGGRTRLANGVVSFVMSATDNFKVVEARWWVLPAGSSPEWDSFFGEDGEDDLEAAKGRAGKLTANFTTTEIIIDTRELKDASEYIVYAMAKDEAGRFSNGGEAKDIQTFYVLQEEDKPHFGRELGDPNDPNQNNRPNISPSNGKDSNGDPITRVVGASGLRLSGTIWEDDGVGSVRIWMSDQDHSAVDFDDPDNPVELNNAFMEANGYVGANGVVGAANGYAGVNVTNWAPSGDTHARIGGFELLTAKAGNSTDFAFTDGVDGVLDTDGIKHYILEATDSASAKLDGDSSASRRKHFSFFLDNTDPLINITYPNPASTITFGARAKDDDDLPNINFYLEGSIEDYLLKKTASGEYYIRFQLGGKSGTIPLGKGIRDPSLDPDDPNKDSYITNITTTQTETKVEFKIPAGVFTTAIGFGDDTTNRNPTLTLYVDDESGKSNFQTLSYIMDIEGPKFSFGNIEPVELPEIGDNDWWSATTNPADYEAKRITTASFTTITYDASSSDVVVPSIRGTFSDDISDLGISAQNPFKVSIDGGDQIIIPYTNPDSQISWTAKNATWTVYLTKDGTNVNADTPTNPILTDGVHSIQLYVEDIIGNTLQDHDKTYGFRLISQTPTSKLTTVNNVIIDPDDKKTFGDRASGVTGATSVFAISGEATGYFLNDVELTIRYTDSVSGKTFEPYKRLVSTPNTGDTNPATVSWSYTLTPSTQAPPDGAGKEEVLETYTWSLNIPRSYILSAGSGGDSLARMRTGNYEIAAVAVDRSANVKRSEEDSGNVWQFSIDSDKPEFSFNMIYEEYDKPANNITVSDNRSYPPVSWTLPSNAQNPIANVDKRNRIMDPSPVLVGRVSDNYLLYAVEVQLSKWDYTATNQNAANWQMYNKTNNTWVTWSVSADADYWISAGVETDPDDEDYGNVNWKFTQEDGATSLVNLPDGYYRVRLRASDASALSTPPSTGWGTANDGNPAYSPYVFFFIDRNRPTVTPDASVGYFSSRNNNNQVIFTVSVVEDENMLEKFEVTLDDVVIQNPNITGLTYMRGGVSDAGTWSDVKITIPFPSTTPDGTHKITYTATDLAGRTFTTSSNITLDNTPPTGNINEPSFRGADPLNQFQFGSLTQIGGESFDIKGTTGDSASGPAGIWYRIGWGTQNQTTGNLPDVSNMTPAEKSAAIMAWAIHSGSGLTGVPTTGNRDTGAAYNANFDDASRTDTAGSLWFKYTGTTSRIINAKVPDTYVAGGSTVSRPYELTGHGLAVNDKVSIGTTPYFVRWVSGNQFKLSLTQGGANFEPNAGDTNPITIEKNYDVPTGFANIPATALDNLYIWELLNDPTKTGVDTVATSYASGSVRIRGRDYVNGFFNNGTPTNVNDDQYLARPINETNLPLTWQKGGLYSLPLVIRVVDNAGNVSYEMRDIWLYPNGDIPGITYSRPSQRFTGYYGNKVTINNVEVTHAPTGAQIRINGMANDNISVKKVIYRVKVDNKSFANAGAQEAGNAPKDTITYTFTTTGNAVNNEIQNNTRYFSHADHRLVVGDTVTVDGTSRYVLWVSGNNFKLSNSYTMINPGNNVWNPNAGNISVTYIYSTIVTIPDATPVDWTGIDSAMATKWDDYSNNNGPGVTESVFSGSSESLSKTGWYVATLEAPDDPSTPWNFVLNAGDEIRSLIESKGFIFGSSTANNMIRVWVETFVFDGDTSGNYSNMSLGADSLAGRGTNTNVNNPRPRVAEFYFTASAPSIDNPQLSKVGNTNSFDGYSRLDNVRGGKFAIKATLSSGSDSYNIAQIRVRLPGESGTLGTGQNLDLSGDTGVTGASLAWTTANKVATLTYVFDSTVNSSTTEQVVRGGAWADSSGTLTIELSVRDSAQPYAEAPYTFEIGIDNFAPVADMEIKITPKKVAGQFADFLGRAFDYEKPLATGPESPTAESRNRGINRIYAWFKKDDDYVSMKNNPGAQGTASIPAYEMNSRKAKIAYTGTSNETLGSIDFSYDNTYGLGTFNPSASKTYPTGDGWLKELSIEKATEAGSGISWTANNDASDVAWSFQTDTTELYIETNNGMKKVTGWIELHYIVVDNSGNASYYTQEMKVMNNRPELEEIILYTDNRGYGAVYTTHTERSDVSTSYPLAGADMSKGYLTRSDKDFFISKRQNIGFEIRTVNGTGNNELNYKVEYVSRQSVGLSSMTNGELYTIHEIGDFNANDWKNIGVDADNPGPGTHFVYNGVVIATGTTAKVWEYTAVTGVPVLEAKSDDPDYAGYGLNRPITPNPTNPTGNNPAGDGFNYDSTTTTFDSTHIKEDMDPPSSSSNFFLIQVWDKVDENLGAAKKDQLHDAVVIFANVYLTDNDAPTAQIYDPNPYFESAVSVASAAAPRGIDQNILRGGLYNVGTDRAPKKSGYIDPRNDSDPLKTSHALRPFGSTGVTADGFVTGDDLTGGTNNIDKVSGKIILRGRAHDNQQIESIKITVAPNGGTSQEKTILQLDTTTGSNTYRELVAAGGNPAWVTDEMHWQTGHTVEWAYVLDTEGGLWNNVSGTNWSNLNGGPYVDTNGGVSIKVTVSDESNNDNSAATDNSLPVDIVPYITGFQRDSKFSTTRSRQGWYSFYQGEPDITVLGYNLGSDGTIALSTDTTNGAALTTTYTPGQPPVFAIGTTSNSGRLDYWVGSGSSAVGSGTQAWNHQSLQATRSWNRENSNRYAGSDLWVNKPHAHIWRTTQDSSAPATYFGDKDNPYGGSHGAENPAMALEYIAGNPGRLTGVWGVYANADIYFARNNGAIRMDGTNSPWGRGFHSAGGGATAAATPPGEPFVNPDVSFFGGNTLTNAIALTYELDGGGTRLRMINDFSSSSAANNTTTSNNPTNVPTDNDSIRIYSVPGSYVSNSLSSGPTKRWQNTRVLRTSGTSTGTTPTANNHAVSYDAYNRALYYTRGGGTIQNENGGTAGTAHPYRYTLGYAISGTGDAGMYSAIDYDDSGLVVAYYDVDRDTLRLATSASLTPTSASDWTLSDVFPVGHALRRGSGTHVSMKIDASNNIHLAFFNSVNNTVVYAVGTRAGNDFKAYIVDKVVTGGQWTDISLEYNTSNTTTPVNPWIVYADSSRTGAYDGVRIAYRDSTAYTRTTADPLYVSTDATGSAGWEALTMPANYIVNNDRLNIESWPPVARGGTVGNGRGSGASAWQAAVGYGSDMFRIGYFYKPNSALMSGGSVNWQSELTP